MDDETPRSQVGKQRVEHPPANVVRFPGAVADEEDGLALSTSSPARQIARQLYLGLRPRMGGKEAVVAAMMEALSTRRAKLPAEAPPADAGLLRVWSAEDEALYQQGQSIEILDSTATYAREHLRELEHQYRVAQDVLRYQTDLVEGPPPIDWDSDKTWPSNAALNVWRGAQSHWSALGKDLQAARDAVSRTDREGVRDDRAEAEYEQLVAALRDQYSGGGPQYEVLVRRLAALDVRLAVGERSRRDVPTDEYKALHDLHLKYVAQLQRHTESLKSESIQPVQDAITRLIQIAERRIKPVNAQLWGELVNDITAAVGEMGAA